MPTHSRPLEPLGCHLGYQRRERKRGAEREPAELTRRHLGGPEIAGVDGTLEAALRGALRGHERMFA